MNETKPVVRVWFIDQFSRFDPNCNGVLRLLSIDHEVIVDNKTPDIIFYASFEHEHLYFKQKDPLLVFYTEENVYPDFNTCDYAVSHQRDSVGGRNYWWPYGISVVASPPPIPEDPTQRNFASFMASHAKWLGAKNREEFTRYLMEKYKHVDCPGKVLHNIDVPDLAPRNGNWHASKLEFLGKYKFNVAFENSNRDGYITEKLTDCFMANTVPIYWGSEGNTAPFPKEAMICANDYPDFDSLIARIKEVDENDELYMAILRSNPLHRKEFMEDMKKHRDGLRNFIKKIVSEALNRKAPGGCHSRRCVGTLYSPIDYITRREKSRLMDEISKITPLDVTTFGKEIQAIHTKLDLLQNNIETIPQNTKSDYSAYQKDLANIKNLVQNTQGRLSNLNTIQDNISNLVEVVKFIYSDNKKDLDTINKNCVGGLKNLQKKQDISCKWEIAVMLLPRYKRQFFRTRVLSHLLPIYKGGLYVRKKRLLRELIIKIEAFIKNNRPV